MNIYFYNNKIMQFSQNMFNRAKGCSPPQEPEKVCKASHFSNLLYSQKTLSRQGHIRPKFTAQQLQRHLAAMGSASSWVGQYKLSNVWLQPQAKEEMFSKLLLFHFIMGKPIFLTSDSNYPSISIFSVLNAIPASNTFTLKVFKYQLLFPMFQC